VSLTLDANVLLYASDRESTYRGRAIDELERHAAGPEPLYLFWPVVMAYVRISTHPSVFSRPLALSDAVANVERLLRRRHVRTPAEEEGFWRVFAGAASEATARGDLVPDTHIVALMRQHGVRTIVTRDRDFRRFDGIKVRDPFR